MPNFKEGDRVRIATREPTGEDAKAGTYYAHFGGLTGTVQKVYSKTEVAVEVDPEALKSEIRKRHEEVRGQMKSKWLEGMSEESRNRLTEREKDFNLRYVVLVSAADLEKAGARAPRKPDPPPEPAVAQEPPRRKTLEELEAAEAEELARRRGPESTP